MRRKNLTIIIGLVVFVILVIGISYSYFVYNKEVADITLDTGDISIDLANINGSINLSSVIPKTDSEGINSTDYIDFTVNGTVDTDRIYYEIYILPKNDNTLDTAYLKIHLTDQANNVLNYATLYNSLTNSQVEGGKAIYRGLVELNDNHTTKNETKNFRLRLWLDENYSELTSKTFNFDVYLYAKNVDENFRLYPAICKRATVLHTETCEQSSDYCYGDGYYTNGSMGTNIVTYGNTEVTNGELNIGDAFDCDVNGNGIVDVDANDNSTERFYYVSPRWIPGTDTTSSSFDSNVAVLIYYSNTYNGQISDSGAAYAVKVDAIEAGSESADSHQNWMGPVTALKHLPKTTTNGGTWQDFILKDNNNQSKRAIIACNDGDCSTTSISTTGGNLPRKFSYDGYAARLLTLPELKKSGCNTLSETVSLSGYSGALKACNFLMEKTRYTDNERQTHGPWMENPHSSDSTNAFVVYSRNRNIGDSSVHNTIYDIRPVIEVPILKMEY